MTKSAAKPVPLIVGEVLFDQFEDGTSVLGGAPFNVAWHLQGFGMSPLFVSRVGDDENGRAVLAAMERWDMRTDGIQVDGHRPTGVVRVELDDGQPKFTILPDQAYDYIDVAAGMDALGDVSAMLVYHGTLATRAPVSRDAVTTLRNRLKAPAFVDLNLRAPWWDHTLVWHALRGARWVKLNEDELRIVADREVNHDSTPMEIATNVAGKYGFELLIVTRGSAGAFAVTESGIVETKPVPVSTLVDTVGAGDAFSAVTIMGLIQGWPISTTLQRAAEFAAQICGNRGATITERGRYSQLLSGWAKQ